MPLELDEFFDQVAKRETGDLEGSVHHAQADIDVMLEAVTPA